MKQNVLVVEDDIGFLHLLEIYLNEWGFATKGVESGEAALSIVENEELDIIILDIEMPGLNGFEVCQQIRQHKDIPIIFISSRRGTMDKVKCFELGGDDYLTKPFDFTELHARIKSNLRRYKIQAKQQTSQRMICGNLEFDLEKQICYKHGKKINLTSLEQGILSLLINEPNQVFSIDAIYDNIWGYDAVGNPETVKVHIKNLRQKLEKDYQDPKHIVTVRGFGYKFNC